MYYSEAKQNIFITRRLLNDDIVCSTWKQYILYTYTKILV